MYNDPAISGQQFVMTRNGQEYTLFEAPFIETGCTVTSPSGQQLTSGGAYITDDRAVVYIGSGDIIEMPVGAGGMLTDWHGNKVGIYWVTSSWPRGTFDRMYAITATINGRTYYGRTQGPGMVASLKAHKHQPIQDDEFCKVCGGERQRYPGDEHIRTHRLVWAACDEQGVCVRCNGKGIDPSAR